jgi:hypothetical protein
MYIATEFQYSETLDMCLFHVKIALPAKKLNIHAYISARLNGFHAEDIRIYNSPLVFPS